MQLLPACVAVRPAGLCPCQQWVCRAFCGQNGVDAAVQARSFPKSRRLSTRRLQGSKVRLEDKLREQAHLLCPLGSRPLPPAAERGCLHNPGMHRLRPVTQAVPDGGKSGEAQPSWFWSWSNWARITPEQPEGRKPGACHL